MQLKKIIFLAGCFALTSSFKTGYDWAQAWVDKVVLAEPTLPGFVFKQVRNKELTLVLLTKKNLITTPQGGNTYLQCFLVNNTDTVTTVARADNTMAGFSTEILKDKTWQPFQHDLKSMCGNSYWTQKLPSRHTLSIRLDHNETGPYQVPFRIRYDHNGKTIYSNEILVNIDAINKDRVGKLKK